MRGGGAHGCQGYPASPDLQVEEAVENILGGPGLDFVFLESPADFFKEAHEPFAFQKIAPPSFLLNALL